MGKRAGAAPIVANPNTRGGEYKANMLDTSPMDEGRKRVLLIAAAILVARNLAQYDRRSPAFENAIADAIFHGRAHPQQDRQPLADEDSAGLSYRRC